MKLLNYIQFYLHYLLFDIDNQSTLCFGSTW